MTATAVAARRPTRLATAWVDGFLWAIRIAAVVFIAWGVLGSIVLTSQGDGLSGAAWRGLFITGLAQGSMYGLIALGYSMVYGVLGFINFAHGEVFMSGAMVAYFAADAFATAGVWESNPAVAIGFTLLVAAVTSMIIAVLVERVAYRSLRGAPRLIPLITSIGMSFFLQYTIRGLFGSGFLVYPPQPESMQGEAFWGVQKVQLLVIVIAFVSMAALYQFVERTKTGRAMRAVAEDKEIAGLMGINVDRTIVTTFAVGGFMAGIAGMLWALLFRQVFFFTGFLPGIKAFTAAVLGGVGNLVGAMLGGVSLGLFEAVGPQAVLGGLSWGLALPLLAAAIFGALLIIGLLKRAALANVFWRGASAIAGGFLLLTLLIPAWRNFDVAIVIPGVTQLKDVVAFTALVLVLVFRPTGLLGERLAVEERG
ncbi:MAG: branched-chain amino acid ABC transporter permease [Acidimicrobiia bacterium]|nr:branched-chain amino acid ABC transporter permease [Acidimicrobiia bacterium]